MIWCYCAEGRRISWFVSYPCRVTSLCWSHVLHGQMQIQRLNAASVSASSFPSDYAVIRCTVICHLSSGQLVKRHCLLPTLLFSYTINGRSCIGSQPAGDVSHKPGGRPPLLSARPAVTPATAKRAAANFAAWWTEAQWLWTACLKLLPDSVAAAIWTRALLRLSPAR